MREVTPEAWGKWQIAIPRLRFGRCRSLRYAAAWRCGR
jgi:hypothetical protein